MAIMRNSAIEAMRTFKACYFCSLERSIRPVCPLKIHHVAKPSRAAHTSISPAIIQRWQEQEAKWLRTCAAGADFFFFYLQIKHYSIILNYAQVIAFEKCFLWFAHEMYNVSTERQEIWQYDCSEELNKGFTYEIFIFSVSSCLMH